MSSTKPIQRITLFKIPEKADQEKLLDIYKGMKQNALKVILSLQKLVPGSNF